MAVFYGFPENGGKLWDRGLYLGHAEAIAFPWKRIKTP